MSFPVEFIPDKDFVFRQITPGEWRGPKSRRFPREEHFELRPGEKGLSVNWEKYIDVENNYILLALTINKRTGNFLNHTAFKIFKYPVSLFRNMENIEDVKHVPLFNGDPSPVGEPNNRAHSEVLYENDVEIFVKLCDYCEQEHESSFCKFDVKSINEKVEELKILLNNTPYHKL